MRAKPLKIDTMELNGEDRFARLELINWWDQGKLKNARVLVIGAGALGNEILKNLALLGIGNILIVDMDYIENSNLSRSILYREEDNGKSKAEVAAREVRNIYPEVHVEWFHGNINYDLGLGVYQWANLVIAGLDNREARLCINRNCWRTNTPWIDGAIEQLCGIVRVFVPPDGACYECTMSETDWKILRSRRACNPLSHNDMLNGKVPTTPTSASVVAGIQCQEAVKLIHGLSVLKSKGYFFNGLTHDSYVIHYPRKENCLSHETFHPILKLDRSVEATTLAELLDEVRSGLGDGAVIEFNKEIVESLVCDSCGESEEVLKSLGQISEMEALCPTCHNMRYPNMFHNINGEERFLDLTLADIGIPPFDIVTGRRNMDQVWIKFNGDATKVLGSLSNEIEP